MRNEADRLRLKEWLFSKGYRVLIHTTKPLQNGWAYMVGERVLVNGSSKIWEKRYDCGENIGLFKALASMNETNDTDQLFFDGGSRWAMCYWHRVRDCDWNNGSYRKATAEETVNYYQTILPVESMFSAALQL